MPQSQILRLHLGITAFMIAKHRKWSASDESRARSRHLGTHSAGYLLRDS